MVDGSSVIVSDPAISKRHCVVFRETQKEFGMTAEECNYKAGEVSR
jgi:hypothetical protein